MRRRLRHWLNPRLPAVEENGAAVASLLSKQAWHPEVEAVLSCCTGVWAISESFGRFLASVVSERGCRNVLEFGAGSSSLVLATALSTQGGGKLTSVEQDPRWCQERWERVAQIENVDAEMIVAKPQLTFGRFGVYYAFKQAGRAIAGRGPYDFVVVDAPQYFYGRDGALPLVCQSCSVEAWIVLDDAARPGERRTLFRWLRTYPGVTLEFYDPGFGDKGLAVLCARQPEGRSWSGRAVLSSVYDLYLGWKYRRMEARNQGDEVNRPLAQSV